MNDRSGNDALTRRQLLKSAGAGVIALGAASCLPSTKIIRVVEQCPPAPEPSFPPLALAEAPPGDTHQQVAGQTSVVPKLRIGELIPGLYGHDAFVKEVAFTFDYMPKPGFTQRALRWLGAQQVQATFFVVGKLVQRYPGLLQQIVEAGHELGNHTYTHPNLGALPAAEIAEELDRTQEIVDQVLGQHTPMRLVRPPYGAPFYGSARPSTIEKVSRVIAERKSCLVLWTLPTGDTRPACSPEKLIRSLKQNFVTGSGGIMVFHPTVCASQSLRRVIRIVRHKAFRVRLARELVEEKYGMPLDELAEWAPKLLPATPTNAGR